MSEKIIIGSRGSDLALWQANYVKAKLAEMGVISEIKVIKTLGDKVQLSWDKMEGKGFFTKEIEDALLKNEIDLAVHSHKDLPTEEVKGLTIAAVSDREDPSELLLINKEAVDEKEKFSLKLKAVVGTSSARRKSQLMAWRPDLQLTDLRGNVPTRVKKLRDKNFDAILIANAGISRLGINTDDFICEKLDPTEFIPAPAQGVLALQVREPGNKNTVANRSPHFDRELFDSIRKLSNTEIEETIRIERKVMNLFQGGCQLPLGVFCVKVEDEDGNPSFRVHVSKSDPSTTGKSSYSFPKYFYFESGKTEGLAEKITDRIQALSQASKVKKIFISRNEKYNDFLKRGLEANNFKPCYQSLIETLPVTFNKNFKADWVFFSSKNAVKYFFTQKPDIGNAKIGAVGKSTADEVRKYGKRADFIGSSDDTRMTGKKFAALAGNKTILFPQAKESMKTIQLQLPGGQNVKNLVVYETIKNPDLTISPDEFDILVFTSPSNVDAFYEKNKISAHQKVVAMGDATANALRNHNVKAHKQPPSFDDLGLLKAVFSL